jgi:hypothetical protein
VRRLLFGFVTAIVVATLALVTVVWAGLLNVAATQHSTILERFLTFATARSSACTQHKHTRLPTHDGTWEARSTAKQA